MKIRPVGAEYLHVERQTDRQTNIDKANSLFRNFAKGLKKGGFLSPSVGKQAEEKKCFSPNL